MTAGDSGAAEQATPDVRLGAAAVGPAGPLAGRGDPFTREIIKDKLIAIADEMGVVLAKTSMSPVVYEVLDFACGLTDARGQVVAQTNGITVFTGTFRPQVESVVRKYRVDGIVPGDVFITNDPYAGATHICDVCLVAPVFHDEALLGFAVSITHWVDIGGAVPGSIPPDATEIHQEGLLVPCLRLVRGGALDEGIVAMIEANVRLPTLALGDLRAGLAAVRIGERGLRAACDRYGRETVDDAIHALLDEGELLARAELARVPKGIYRARDVIDGDGISDDPIPVEVVVTVGDNGLIVDFTGTASQTPGPVNCARGALESACKTIFRAITEPHARSNEGAFRALSVVCPPGTVFTAQRPAPTGWYYESTAFATELVWRALAPVIPRRLGAGSYVSLCATYVVGGAPEPGGEAFILVEPNNGGWGADAEGDGESGLIATPDGDTYNFPAEVVESRFPLRVERYALATGIAGGAGRHRGGFGVVREYRVLAPGGVTSYGSIGGWRRRPWGLHGGRDGTTNHIEYVRGDGQTSRHGRAIGERVAEGEVIRVITGAGGGYGDPIERDPERVSEDVLDGYVTEADAEVVYGVVLDGGTGRVDQVATAKRRGA